MRLPGVIKKILEAIRVETPIGGLEISDSNLRFAVPGVGHWDVYSQKLSVGVVQDGIIKDPARFKEAAEALRKLVKERYGRKKIPVIVSLASSQIYTQALPLPIIQESEADKVIDLNLKMVSPLQYDEVYAGWQYVKKDQTAGRFEILSAFLRRSVVETLDQALEEAHFRPLALEPRSLSLARLLRNLGGPQKNAQPVAILSVNDEGINFLVVKEGQLYFEYTELWRNLYEAGKTITAAEFQSAIKRSVQQLVNFYSQKWPEPLSEFLIVAPSLVLEVEKVLKDDFSFPARELVFSESKAISGEWFAAVGAAWRGFSLSREDDELSLLGHTARNAFGRERFIDFLALWSVITPVTLGLIMIGLLATDFMIVKEVRRLQLDPILTANSSEQATLAALEARASRFNANIGLIQTIRQGKDFKGPLIENVLTHASSSAVEVTSLRMQNERSLLLNGRASSQEKIIAFKNDLKNSGFTSVDLPLSTIRQDGANYTFTMTFSLNTANTP
ncbi:MAG: pilus assembly protein PilM [Patescibacteria group bacterium]